MSCAGCGLENPAGARFCGGCGASLAPRCPSCGTESPAGSRFCISCGAALAVRPAEASVARKVVTIVFADLIGSTALHERLDPESVTRLMDRYHRAVRAPIEAHGGTVVQLLGDGVMCAFGVPRVAEDDAIRAVRAAVEVQRSFREFALAERALAGELGLRVAINTGEVVVSDEHAAGIGDPLNVAARLQQEAQDGDVLIGGETQRLVRELVTLEPVGRFALKGRAEPVAAFRVVSLERPGGVASVAFVGRDAELRRLGAVYDAAVAAPAARLAVVLGSPGLGKSRLLAELARRLGEQATVLVAQCNAAGGATFAPLAEALRAHFGLPAGAGGDALRAAIDACVPGEEAERARIAAGIGALLAGTPASPEETFFVVRRLLAALAATRPLVLEIDDLQWAEPLLLDLTEHLVQWGAGVPLLVLAAARPELRSARSSLTSAGGAVAEVVTLAGLDAAAATRLAAGVIGADVLPAAVAGRVLATSEGNPLFLGELVRMLVNDGALKREGERWTAAAELAHLEMPPTIQALLAARIERLGPEERLVLERAAVVGRQFSRSAVAHLLPREAQADLDARLESLRRSELIEPDPGWLLAEPALRFHHVLIRDAAYRRLLRHTRAELHGRFADWLESKSGDSVEHGETIGWHLEQAHQHLRGLGPLDADGRALGARAARYLAAAGRRALARDDLPPSGSLLGRALDRLDAADPARADLALDWCEALLAAGDVAPATRALAELERLAVGSERLRAWHTCFAGQLAVLNDPQALRTSAAAVAAAAASLTAAGDVAGEAKAHAVHALVLAQLGMIGACEAALDRALAAARRAGDRRRANAVLAGAPVAALWGPSPVTRASGRCLDVVRVLRITQGAPAVEAVALRCQAVLETLRGRADAARRMIASSRQMVEELGITQRVLEADLFAGLIELLEGDAAAAERWLRAAWDGLREQGLGIDAAQAAALLGRARLAQGRGAEAEALSRESEALAGDSFKAGIAWRCLRAEALAARGEAAPAVEVARAAVEIATATDDLLDHADARASLAVALRAAGRAAEADAEQARAIELWEAKGATLLVERARAGVRSAPLANAGVAPRLAAARAAQRRVSENAATANEARLHAARMARDLAGYTAALSDSLHAVHHPTGARYGREEVVDGMRRMLATTPDWARRFEPLATLGASLALIRTWDAASRSTSRTFDVGPVEREQLNLVEVGSDGRRERAELFASDSLADAVVRLYQRHAELLPAGPARERAAATARSVAALLAVRPELERWGTAFAPDIEWIDHRTVGFGAVHGAEAVLRGIGALFELMDVAAVRVDDVFDARADALVLRWTNLGTDRAGGGSVERNLCQVWIFGADGRLSHWEQLDPDRDAEALARLDALVGEGPASGRAPRRLRQNAATANEARVHAALVACDLAGYAAGISDVLQVVHHPTGATYGRAEAIESNRRILASALDSVRRSEPLATLGEALALIRVSDTAAGSTSRSFDVGPIEREHAILIEVGADGRRRRSEVFAAEHLADATARLYARYAELLPEGPEREGAAATARSVAAMMTTPDRSDRLASALSPGLEVVDQRTLGTWSGRGPEALLRSIHSLLDVSAEVAVRVDDVLALEPRGYLVRWTTSGTDRATGGAFERSFLMLCVYGDDGLLAHCGNFDLDREAEALARFDALTPEPRAGNAAWRALQRFERAWAARDWDGVRASYAPDHRMDDRRKLMRMQVAGEQFLANERLLFDTPGSVWRNELVATRGEELALCRTHFHADGGDRGPTAVENLDLVEVDGEGRRRELVVFDPEDAAAAHAELERRFAAGSRAARVRPNAATANSARILAAVAARDAGALADAFADDLDAQHHPTATRFDRQGAITLLRMLFTARDPALRHEALATLGDRLGLFRASTSFSELAREGLAFGASERETLMLMQVDAAGRQRFLEFFASDRLGDAIVRLYERHAELLPEGLERSHAAASARVAAAWSGPFDPDGLATALPPDIEVVDHRTLGTWSMRGAEGLLQSLRGWSDLADDVTRRADDILALRADALLARWNHLGIDRTSGGAYERPFLLLWTLGADGLLTHWELFDPEREAEALARFDALTAALPTAPRFENAATRAAERLRDAWSSRDLERYAAVFAPAFRQFDRRKLVQLELDREQWLAFARMIFDRISSPLELELLATRGDRLALGRVRIEAADESVGPSVIESVNVFEVDERGQHVRMVRFDPDDLAAAYAELDARFDGLVAALPAAPARRRVRENGATAHHARLAAAIAARDADALPGLLADDFEAVNHAMGATVDREGPLLAWRRALQAEGAKLTREPLAALGDSLALDRQVWSSRGYAGDTYDIGPVVFEALYLTEVNARGQARRSEAFAADKLGDAIVRLYERHAELLPEGPERTRSTATARSIATRISHLDVFFATFAPDVEAVDHRVLGTWSARGMAPLREQFRSLLDLTEDLALRFDDVLGLRNDAHLVRATNSGQLRAGGGTYERTFLMLRQTNADGLFRRVEWFDPEREAEALARFDALTAAPTAPQIENAATRSIARFEAALEARDWPGIAAGAAPDFRQIDRRGLVQLDLDRDQHLEWLRVGLERPSWRSESEVLATRGDRLALGRVRSVESDQSVGPSENEWLALVELNERGQRSAIVMFDPGDLDAAYAELDARYDAGEAAAHPGTRNLVRRFAAAIAARDWAQLAAVMAPDFVQVDHRPPGLLSSLSRDEWVASVRALAELRPDVTLRGEHVLALDDQGFLVVSRWLGRESEGAFETPVVVVGECGGGAIRQWHGYELDQLDAARARFAAIRAGASRDPLAALARPNAASAALDRLQAGFAERDWAGVRALAAPGARFEDRRRHARTSGDVDWWLSDLRQIAGAEAGSLRYARKLVVTAGERVCLERVLWAGGPAGGRVEIEYLWLAEVDAAGRLAAGIAFDLEDRRAASREARARWMARDALAAEVLRTAVEFTEAMNDRDAARLRASFADDLVVHDRRRTGMGVIEGADAYLDSIRALWELAPESVWDSPFHLALEPHGRVHVVEISGTLADGGRFERWLVGIWITTGERIARIELFELEDASAALARFAELRPGTQAPRAARTVRPNAASRNAAQLVAAVRARDAAAVPGLFSDDFEAVDHSTGASYGHTGAVDTTRMLLEHRDLVFRQDPLATLGDQLALCLNRQTSSGVVRGAMDVGATELETLLVAEVDERGRRRRNERFRADRLADAIVRLYERHAELLPEGPERTREAATARTVATLEGPLDAERYATTLAPDAELRDWRSLGLWTARGREAAVRAFQTMLELVGSFEVRIAEILDLRADALLLRCNNTGTLREGGGAYERSFILLLRFAADGLVAQSEVFESERDTEALARFDALAAQPPPRFENAATRAMEQTMEAWRTRDWQRIEARIPEGFQLLDRRKLVQLELDRDGAIEYLRSTFGLAPRIDIAVLATRGERLALARVLGEMGAGDVGASEIESLMLYEMDARGARKALIRFDLDDLDAAYAELDARFDAGEAAACPRARATMRATTRAWLDRDWDATLRLCAPDFAFCDHRLLGWGTTIRDAAGWMQTQQVLVELAPDVRIRFDHVRIGARGFLRQAHQQGTRDGGAFEMQWLIVRELDDLGRILRNDYYDLDRIDEAFARFAELSRPAPDPQRIPPNAATRARELQQRAREAGDQDDFAARLAPGMLFDDRRRGIRLTGDRDTFLASARVVATARTEHTLLATAGERLAVYRARWHQPGAEAPFEVEMLQLWESDARGRIAALIIFDPGDRRAAFRELAERHARSEEGAALPEPVHELRLALLDGDLERARAVFPPDFAVHDHRRNRLWRIEGRDAWIAWMATLFEQSPDAIMAARCYLAVEPHGCLLLGYSGGTLAEGGEFEQEFLSLWRFRGGRLVGLEMFEVEDLERARARLEELRPGPGE